jgi:hypothetical protein
MTGRQHLRRHDLVRQPAWATPRMAWASISELRMAKVGESSTGHRDFANVAARFPHVLDAECSSSHVGPPARP